MKRLIFVLIIFLFSNVLFGQDSNKYREAFYVDLQLGLYNIWEKNLLSQKGSLMIIPIGVRYMTSYKNISHSVGVYYGYFIDFIPKDDNNQSSETLSYNKKYDEKHYSCGIINPQIRLHSNFSDTCRQYLSFSPLLITGGKNGIILKGQIGFLWLDLGGMYYKSTDSYKITRTYVDLELLSFGLGSGKINNVVKNSFDVNFFCLSISLPTVEKRDPKINPKSN